MTRVNLFTAHHLGRGFQQSLPWFRIDLITVVVLLVTGIFGTWPLGVGRANHFFAWWKVSRTRFWPIDHNQGSTDHYPLIETTKHQNKQMLGCVPVLEVGAVLICVLEMCHKMNGCCSHTQVRMLKCIVDVLQLVQES